MNHARTGFFHIALIGFITVLLQGCVTTTTGSVDEKWSPEERAQAHVDLGMTYLRENQLDTAEQEFTDAIANNPNSGAAYHAMGLLMSKRGNKQRASEYLAKAVSIDPDDFVAVNDYAVDLCIQGDTKKGIKELMRIESNPSNDQVLGTQLSFGICYQKNGNLELAEQYLRTVLSVSPYIPQALLPMAEISYAKGEFLSARAFLERYFNIGAISPKSLFLAVNVEYKLGDKLKANQYRREYLRLYPGNPEGAKLNALLQ